MSNFIPVENRTGIQPIAQSNGALPSQYQTGQSQLFGQAHPLGTIIRAYDTASSLGEGEFIYLEGVASTVVGTLVTYNNFGATTTLVPNTASQNAPVAVAMSANVANQFGWYQISGVARISRVTGSKTSPSSKLSISSTAGSVQGGSVAGKQVMNCISANTATVASAAVTILAQIDRPFMEPVAT